MIKIFIQGFLFGLAYAAPIGMQNLYVINTALSMGKLRVYATALITIFFDISLALACFFGIGLIFDRFSYVKTLLLIIGCAAVTYIGITLIFSNNTESKEVKVNHSLLKVVSICFAVTWLNPQAIIDGTLLLGGIRASLDNQYSSLFILGAASASFTWFMSLSTLVMIFKSAIRLKTIRYINVFCGSILVFYGIKLGYSLLF